MALKVRDTLGVTEEFTLYDPDDVTVSADKKIHVITSASAHKVVPLELSSVNSQRSVNSRLYYHDGTNKYRACTTKFNIVSSTFDEGYLPEDAEIVTDLGDMLFKLDGNEDPNTWETYAGGAKTVTWPVPSPASRFLQPTTNHHEFLVVGYALTFIGTAGDHTFRIRWKEGPSIYGAWTTIKDHVVTLDGSSSVLVMDSVYLHEGLTPVLKYPRTGYGLVNFQFGIFGESGDMSLDNLSRHYVKITAASAIA